MGNSNWNASTPARRWRSARELYPFGAFPKQITSLFDDILQGFEPVASFQEKLTNFTPKLEVFEDKDAMTIKAELPGLDEKDVEITLTKDAISLRGEKKEEHEEKEGKSYYRMERSYGMFERSIPLSFEVEEDKVDATFKKGVLTVKLPKSQRAQSETRKVSIKTVG